MPTKSDEGTDPCGTPNVKSFTGHRYDSEVAVKVNQDDL